MYRGHRQKKELTYKNFMIDGVDFNIFLGILGVIISSRKRSGKFILIEKRN